MKLLPAEHGQGLVSYGLILVLVVILLSVGFCLLWLFLDSFLKAVFVSVGLILLLTAVNLIMRFVRNVRRRKDRL